MSKTIQIPDIGSDKVVVTEIMVAIGDSVAVDQSIINVEGDKASMEVPSPEAGIVKEILVKVGDEVSTGTPMLVLAASDAITDKAASAETAAGAMQKEFVKESASTTTKTAEIKDVVVPDIGGDEVSVTEIMVGIGDKVSVEQSLITVEGDKASMEVPAPFAGTIKEILIKSGDKVATGSLIMRFEILSDTENNTENKQSQSSDIAPATPLSEMNNTVAIQDINVPDIGNDEVDVTEVMVKVGDNITAEQSLITVEGDKASMEVPSPFAGVVKEILIKPGDKVATGSLIMRFEVAGKNASVAAVVATNETKPSMTHHATAGKTQVVVASEQDISLTTQYAHATPVVRRLAREFGVNLEKVKATGPKGRILKEDVQLYIKNALKQLASPSPSAGAGLDLLPWPKVDMSKFGEIEEVELGRIQKLSGANLHRNWVLIPHVTQWDKADITDLEAFRKEQNALAEKQKLDVKFTPLVFIMKAVAKALEQFPRFNSSLSEDKQKLILKKYVHIGVAVDTPNGLVVPVFRDVNKKSVIELSRELTEISKKARVGKLTASDMQGGSFTISSLGGIGGTHFTPIVNAPEVAILGVSKSETSPVWNGKEFTPRLMLPLSLSYDHRVIDGANGARFITFINGILSDLRRLIM